MKLERSDVEFPIWRKKVDKSLFEHNRTSIPEWACRMWELPKLYASVSSKEDCAASALVMFKGKNHSAWVATARHGRSSPAYRLFYDSALSLELKRTFLMSYMRSLEGCLAKNSATKAHRKKNAVRARTKCNAVEASIPFWEFLNIEFDKKARCFKLEAYYTQQPSFPHLFASLIGSAPGKLGVIEEGALADLLLVDGDPLQNMERSSKMQ